jgi:hypothetical protein
MADYCTTDYGNYNGKQLLIKKPVLHFKNQHNFTNLPGADLLITRAKRPLRPGCQTQANHT